MATRPKNVTLEQHTITLVQAEADALGMTFSSFVEYAVRQFAMQSAIDRLHYWENVAAPEPADADAMWADGAEVAA